MKKIIIYLMKKNQFIRTLIRKIVFLGRRIVYNYYCKKNNVDENMIIFESFLGRTYSDNPRALYEELVSNSEYKNFKCVWCFQKPEEKKNIKELENAILVKYNSREYYKYYSKAKYFISNSRIPEAIKPRDTQVYLQTWHGTPLKRLGYDMKAEGGNAMNSLKDMKKKYKDDAERYNYLLSPSEFCTEKFISAFNLKENNPNCKIIEEGYPRNDLLSKFTKEDQENVKKKLNIDNIKNKKIILYAPTWRDNQHMSAIGYTYKTEVDFDKLQEKLAKDYIILFRAHYFVANSFDFEKYRGFIYDVSNYENINELYIISDMLITDYSSVFFDYAILKRPMLFYMYDLKEYSEDIRGFYIDLNELPGPIIQTEEELINNIKEIDKKEFYDEKYKKFNQKFNYLDDGNVSKRVIKEIIK